MPIVKVLARQIARVAGSDDETHKTGAAMRELHVVEDGALVLDDEAGTILMVGPRAEVDAAYPDAACARVDDHSTRAVIPGLVDCHAHCVWAGCRIDEYAAKLAGATYLEIHQQGGGIQRTVRATQAASEEELAELLAPRLSAALRHGTTLMGALSGYGLAGEQGLATELKMLRVLRAAQGSQPVELVCGYLGAHSVPPGMSAQQACDDIVHTHLPAVAAANARGEVSVELVDVFCERGVFDVAQARAVLTAGQALGLRASFHGDELSPIGAAEMAGEIGAVAVSHLEHVSPAGMVAMAAAGTTAVLLPTTAHILRLEPPPARALIDAGVPVALATDFNPNAHCLSMPFTASLACVTLRLTPAEALTAATINAAHALGRGRSHGALRAGRAADLVVLDGARWEAALYDLNGHTPAAVYKGGKRVV